MSADMFDSNSWQLLGYEGRGEGRREMTMSGCSGLGAKRVWSDRAARARAGGWSGQESRHRQREVDRRVRRCTRRRWW